MFIIKQIAIKEIEVISLRSPFQHATSDLMDSILHRIDVKGNEKLEINNPVVGHC